MRITIHGKLDPGLQVAILFQIWEDLHLQFGVPLCIMYYYVFDCPRCKDKHKHVIPQTMIRLFVKYLEV